MFGRSPFYAVSVNCLYRDRVRVRHPDSSGNLLIRRKMDYARQCFSLYDLPLVILYSLMQDLPLAPSLIYSYGKHYI